MTRTHAWGTQPEMFGPRHEYRLGLFTRETATMPPSRLLDAAVGLGQLAEKLRDQGHRVFGLDASIEAAHYLRCVEIPVVLGDMTRLPFRSNCFDAVTSGETLEHLDDDGAAVAEMSRVIRMGGRCVISVPALQLLWNASDDYAEHRRRYSRRQLRRLFDGFSIQRAAFWGFPMVLLYDWLLLLPINLRRARHDPESDRALQIVARAGKARWLVQVVQAAFSLDKLFSFIPFGPGLLLVAEKKSVRPGD